MLFNNSWAVIVAQLEEQQCDQKKIAKCLLKWPKNDFTREMIDLQKLPKNVGRFGQINCCQRL